MVIYFTHNKCLFTFLQELVSPDETLGYLVSTLKALKMNNNFLDCSEQDSKSKVSKFKKEDDVHSEKCSGSIFKYKNVVPVKSSSILEVYCEMKESSSKKLECDHEITTERIINCFVHPDVIKLVCQLLKDI